MRIPQEQKEKNRKGMRLKEFVEQCIESSPGGTGHGRWCRWPTPAAPVRGQRPER